MAGRGAVAVAISGLALVLVIFIFTLSPSLTASSAKQQALKGKSAEQAFPSTLTVDNLVIHANSITVDSSKRAEIPPSPCPAFPSQSPAPNPLDACPEASKSVCSEHCRGDGQCLAKCCGLRIFFGVISKASNSDRRDAARKTWIPGCPGRAHFFMLATGDDAIPGLLQENKKHRDMAYLPYVKESYFEVMHQVHTLFMVGSADKEYTHVMKVDDDSVVDCRLLIPWLMRTPATNTVIGTVHGIFEPDRNPESKWHLPIEEFPDPTGNYPWVNGPGYVYTRDVAELVSFAAVQLRKFFKLEDIGMARLLDYVNKNLEPVNFHDAPDFIENDIPCIRPNIVVNHYVTAADMVCYHEKGRRCNC